MVGDDSERYLSEVWDGVEWRGGVARAAGVTYWLDQALLGDKGSTCALPLLLLPLQGSTLHIKVNTLHLGIRRGECRAVFVPVLCK